MTGDSTVHLIFYIGAIMITVGIIGVVSGYVGSITASYGMNSRTLADQLRTEITIINDPQIIPYKQIGSNYIYSFYVKNTGKITLYNASVDLLVDGKYVPNASSAPNVSTKIERGGNVWYPSYVLIVNYTTGTRFSNNYDHNVTVVAGNGVLDSMPFKCIEGAGCD